MMLPNGMRDWSLYGMAAMKGGGPTTTVVTTPAPTAEERALTQKQVDLAEAQLKAIQQQTDLQKLLFEGSGDLAAKQTEILNQLIADANKPPSERELKMQGLQDELVDRQLEALRRGGAASAEELALIGEATDQAIQAGQFDIDRFSGDAFDQLREELAPALGLSASDTPILDRGGRVASEAVRQKGQLSANLRSAEAQAKLNFPLAREQLLAGVSQGQQQLLQSAEQFQAGLRSQALLNRLSVSEAMSSRLGMTMQGGLGLATGIPGASSLASAASGLAANRMGNRTQTTTGGGGGFGIGEAFGALGGVGGFMSGLAAISAREKKQDFRPVDGARIAEKVAALPVEFWTYRDDPAAEHHVGPMAGDFAQVLGIGDGQTINLMDANGVLFAAVGWAVRKIREMEHGRIRTGDGHSGAADGYPAAAPA
jgi:hypothetical protein